MRAQKGQQKRENEEEELTCADRWQHSIHWWWQQQAASPVREFSLALCVLCAKLSSSPELCSPADAGAASEARLGRRWGLLLVRALLFFCPCFFPELIFLSTVPPHLFLQGPTWHSRHLPRPTWLSRDLDLEGPPRRAFLATLFLAEGWLPFLPSPSSSSSILLLLTQCLNFLLYT